MYNFTKALYFHHSKVYTIKIKMIANVSLT